MVAPVSCLLLTTDMSTCGAEMLQRQFRAKGWTLAGANLLAAACLLSQTELFLYLRPTLAAADGALALALTVSAAATVAVAMTSFLDASWEVVTITLLFVGCAAGGSYLLWKASCWQPAKEIITERMERKAQRLLVDDLVAVCQHNNINPEDLDRLIAARPNELAQIRQAMVEFFHEHMKMQE